MGNKALRRSRSDRVFAGVCGGIAEYFNINSLLVRILFILSGIGFVAYILMAIFIDE